MQQRFYKKNYYHLSWLTHHGLTCYPQNKCRKDYWLQQVQAGNTLRSFWTSLDKFSIHCIRQNKLQRKYTIINSNQCKDEYNIHQFRGQQDLWCTQVNLTDKVERKRSGRGVALLELIIFYKWKSIIKSHKHKLLDKTLVQIYVNKAQNRITFKLKTHCYYELLMPCPKLWNYWKYWRKK